MTFKTWQLRLLRFLSGSGAFITFVLAFLVQATSDRPNSHTATGTHAFIGCCIVLALIWLFMDRKVSIREQRLTRRMRPATEEINFASALRLPGSQDRLSASRRSDVFPAHGVSPEVPEIYISAPRFKHLVEPPK